MKHFHVEELHEKSRGESRGESRDFLRDFFYSSRGPFYHDKSRDYFHLGKTLPLTPWIQIFVSVTSWGDMLR